MKKLFEHMLLAAVMLSVTATFTACSSDDDDDNTALSEKEMAMQALTEQYVNNVIYPIYSSLANQTDDLFNKIVNAKNKFRAGTITQSDIDQICTVFINARSAWEQSESFL